MGHVCNVPKKQARNKRAPQVMRGATVMLHKQPRTEKGPELVGEVLSRLFAARGWGRRQARLHLEQAWTEAVGPEQAEHSRVIGIRRGTLEVEVDNGVLLQELAHFHKRRLLEQLRRRLPETTIVDLRFRAGTGHK